MTGSRSSSIRKVFSTMLFIFSCLCISLVLSSVSQVLFKRREARSSLNPAHPWLAVHTQEINPIGTIFTCVTDHFYYLKHFLYMYVGEGYDIKVFRGDQVLLNGMKLTVHWCRVWVLLNEQFRPGPIIYIDADTRLNLNQLKTVLKKFRKYDGLIMTNGSTRGGRHEIRTNWFIVPNLFLPRTWNVLQKWSTFAKNTPLQDQRVLNNIFPACRMNKGLLCFQFEHIINSTHCGSHSRPRYKCMKDMIHREERIPVYQRSTSTRLK